MTPERITENTLRLRQSLPQGVELVAVSKFHPSEAIMASYRAGQRSFGESRAAEFVAKAKTLPEDISWHFIGHLQRNKVRQVVPYVSMIQSVDSERLLRLIDAEACRVSRKVSILLQVHVAKEETKTGFAPEELAELACSGIFDSLNGVLIEGVMGMASNTDDLERVASDFDQIRQAYESLASGSMAKNSRFRILSMGMSHDYQLAISHGSNMVRIGTGIFGEREY